MVFAGVSIAEIMLALTSDRAKQIISEGGIFCPPGSFTTSGTSEDGKIVANLNSGCIRLAYSAKDGLILDTSDTIELSDARTDEMLVRRDVADVSYDGQSEEAITIPERDPHKATCITYAALFHGMFRRISTSCWQPQLPLVPPDGVV